MQLPVKQAIFTSVKYMRLKETGFIDDKYINLVTVFKTYSVSTITEILPVFTCFIYV